MKLLEVQQKLRAAGLVVFTTAEFRRVTGFTWSGARKFLLRYCRVGLFGQLRRGTYVVREPLPHLWLLANKLYQPSYISLESALSHYGVIPETVHAVTSVTSRLTREFEALDQLFLYHKIKQAAYQGYCPLILEGKTILIAEAEKALADHLYFVHLGKRTLNDRIAWSRIRKNKLRHHLKTFERKTLLAWSHHVIP